MNESHREGGVDSYHKHKLTIAAWLSSPKLTLSDNITHLTCMEIPPKPKYVTLMEIC